MADVLFSTKLFFMGGAASIRSEKINQHKHDRRCDAQPKQRPTRRAIRCTKRKPPTAAEVADEITHAAGHHGEQGLRSATPRWINPLFEINLGRDEHQGEAHAMQGESHEQGKLRVHRTKEISHRRETEADYDYPLQSPAREQSRESEHSDDFGDLAESHPRGGASES